MRVSKASNTPTPPAGILGRQLPRKFDISGDGQSPSHPCLREAQPFWGAGHLRRARTVLEDFVAKNPVVFGALRLLAEIAAREGRNKEMQKTCWPKCVKLAPGSRDLEFSYVSTLDTATSPDAALQEIEKVLTDYRGIRTFWGAEGHFAGKQIEEYEAPRHCGRDWSRLRGPMWAGCASAMRSGTWAAGSNPSPLNRNAIELNPSLRPRHWSLASIKTSGLATSKSSRWNILFRRADLPAEDRPAAGILHSARQYADMGLYG